MDGKLMVMFVIPGPAAAVADDDAVSVDVCACNASRAS
jgi:hypothetical protein